MPNPMQVTQWCPTWSWWIKEMVYGFLLLLISSLLPKDLIFISWILLYVPEEKRQYFKKCIFLLEKQNKNSVWREFTPWIISSVSLCGLCWIFLEWNHLPSTNEKDYTITNPIWNEPGSYWTDIPIWETEQSFPDHRNPGWRNWGLSWEWVGWGGQKVPVSISF